MKLWFKKVFSLLVADLTEYFRIPFIIISAALTPVMMLLSFGFGSGGDMVMLNNHNYFNYIAPGILAVGTMFSSTCAAGYTIIHDRQRKILNDFILSPISYSSFVIARILGVIVKSGIPLIITLVIGYILFDVSVVNVYWLILAFTMSSILYAGLGIILGTISNVLAFEGFANFFLIPSMYFGGVFFPITNYKEFGKLIYLLVPITSSVEMFRFGIAGYLTYGDISSHLALLFVYDMIAISLGVTIFKQSQFGR